MVVSPLVRWTCLSDASGPAHLHADRMNSLKEALVGLLTAAFCLGSFAGAIALGVHDGDRECWRGTAQSVDCDALGPCNEVNGHPRIIDVELNYAKRHPDCQADWTPDKRRYAEAYWRGDGKDQ